MILDSAVGATAAVGRLELLGWSVAAVLGTGGTDLKRRWGVWQRALLPVDEGRWR